MLHALSRRARPFALATVVFFLALTPFASHAAQTVHLTLTLNGQVIEGDSTISSLGRANTIECLSFSVAGFHDLSRLPPSARSYRPVTLRKRIDRASPLLAQAWATNQNQGEAVFRFYRPNSATGAEEQFYTIVLLNPQIVALSTSAPDTIDPATLTSPNIESLSFVFEAIRYIDEINGTVYEDRP